MTPTSQPEFTGPRLKGRPITFKSGPGCERPAVGEAVFIIECYFENDATSHYHWSRWPEVSTVSFELRGPHEWLGTRYNWLGTTNNVAVFNFGRALVVAELEGTDCQVRLLDETAGDFMEAGLDVLWRKWFPEVPEDERF